jgi:hypothetical protein
MNSDEESNSILEKLEVSAPIFTNGETEERLPILLFFIRIFGKDEEK